MDAGSGAGMTAPSVIAGLTMIYVIAAPEPQSI